MINDHLSPQQWFCNHLPTTMSLRAIPKNGVAISWYNETAGTAEQTIGGTQMIPFIEHCTDRYCSPGDCP